MVSIATILACVITLLASVVLPIGVLIIFGVKNKRQGIFSAWLLGAAGFFVTQIIIRVPLLAVLQAQSWFMGFAQSYPLIYVSVLAFTAGLFELAGRFGVAKLMEKKLTFKRSVAAGLGHGGIEAIMLTGMTYVNNLIFIIMINSGVFDMLIANIAESGVDLSQLEMIKTQLIGTAPAMFLLAGIERLLAMTCHIAMSTLVCYGVAHKKVGCCSLLCLGIHTLIDFTAGIPMILPQNIAYPVIYAVLTAIAVVSIVILKRIQRKMEFSYNI